jgi:hypothetical protein
LPVCDPNGPLANRALPLELLGQRGLSDSWLPADKDKLPLAAQGAPPSLM